MNPSTSAFPDEPSRDEGEALAGGSRPTGDAPAAARRPEVNPPKFLSTNPAPNELYKFRLLKIVMFSSFDLDRASAAQSKLTNGSGKRAASCEKLKERTASPAAAEEASPGSPFVP